MSKVWIAKQWINQNPPPVGSRVFVGGANGSGHYETINAGETKRILQSNGQGNIFYGNVTVDYPPLEPALHSNLPAGDYSSWTKPDSSSTLLNTNVFLEGVPSQGSTSRYYSTRFYVNDYFDFREGTAGYFKSIGSLSNPSIQVKDPYNANNFISKANKLTLYYNSDYWIVFNITGRQVDLNNSTKINFAAWPTVKNTSLGAPNADTLQAIEDKFKEVANIWGEYPIQIIFSNEPTWSN